MMARELIDFSRGKTRLQVGPMIVTDLVNDLKSQFEKCQPFIEVRTEIGYKGAMEADRYRLIRVFGNLIRNAREAIGMREGSRLIFSVEQIEPNNVRFVVSDNGPGIPNELLPQIFEPFVTHGKADGTGLGLAISKAVVEAHHGTITVASSEKGTTFHIDLPVKQPSKT
jgi:signal transduction histidine kinase